MASLTGNLVAETYKALLKTIDNDILTASEKQITDGLGGGSNVFIDSNGFLRANKYKVTNGLATQFLKADGSFDANTYLTSITGAQVITALGYTPVTNQRTLTINGVGYNLSADRSWTVEGTAAVWGNITGTLSNQTDLQNALNAKYDDPTGTISQYIRGDGSIANFPALTGYVPYTGATANVDLGEYALSAEYLAIDTDTTHVTDVGEIVWNPIDGTFDMGLLNGVVLQAGQELHFYGKATGAIGNGQAVMFAGVEGDHLLMSLADAATINANPQYFIGIATQDFVNNEFGYVTVLGKVRGLNTTSYSLGDVLYYNSTSATDGLLTTTMPIAPNAKIEVAAVVRVHATQGILMVRPHIMPKLNQIQDVYIADPANNHGIFYDLTAGYWRNTSIATALGYTPQAQLSGTGFVKASGTTISYDNSTYLTTSDAASTYQRLDKMVSNLLASDTEYPNSNAVIAALALKANAANPVFTGNMTISGTEPKLFFTDTDNNPDYTVFIDSGVFYIYDQTAGTTRFSISSTGNISAGVGKSITADSFIKDGGTASQVLMADGSVSAFPSLAGYLPLSGGTMTGVITTPNGTHGIIVGDDSRLADRNIANTLFLEGVQNNDRGYINFSQTSGNALGAINGGVLTWRGVEVATTTSLANYLLITTAASTYQRLDKMVSNLLASDTEYPNSNAVIAALALKANAANPVFTGDLSISGATPRLYFVDTDQNPDYTVFIDSGFFYIYDQTAGATRFSINSSGNISTGVGKSITAGSIIRDGGTASQFLMADGSVSTFSGVTGSGTTNFLPKFTSANAIGNSIISEVSSKISITSSSAYGWIYSNDVNHSIILRADRNGTVLNYTNYYQYGGTLADGLGHKFWTGGGIDVQSLRLQIADNGVYVANNLGVGIITPNSSVRFHVYDTSANGDVALFQSDATKTDIWLKDTNTTVGHVRLRSESNAMIMIAGNNDRIKLFPNGNTFIGSGATDAGYRFDVNGTGRFQGALTISTANSPGLDIRKDASADNRYLRLTNTQASSKSWDLINQTNANGNKFVIYNATNDLVGLEMLPNGYATLPNGTMTAFGFTATSTYSYLNGLRISGADAGNTIYQPSGDFSISSDGGNIRLMTNAATNIIWFFTQGSERVRITAAGNIDVSAATNINFGGSGKGIFLSRAGIGPRASLTTRTDVTWVDIANSSDWSGVTLVASGGKVLIGTTTDNGSLLQVNGTTSLLGTTALHDNQLRVRAMSDPNHAIVYNGTINGPLSYGYFGAGLGYTEGGAANITLMTYRGNVMIGYTSDQGHKLAVNGSVLATSFFESSDFRLKKLIDHNPIIDGIEKLEAKLYEKNGKIELGYFAQDAELIMPYAVTKNADGFLNLSYREVHTAKIARLEQRVAELEKQLNLN